MPSRQPASKISTTVAIVMPIVINRSINEFCAGLTRDAIPTSPLPFRSDMIITFLITTIGIATKVMLADHVVP